MDKEDRYSSLITVIALVIVVTYANSGYDIWDVVICVIGGSYIFFTWKSEKLNDVFTLALTFFLGSFCLVTLIFSLIELYEHASLGCFIDTEFIVTLIIMILSIAIYTALRNRK
jgi:hypothetical protein